MLDAAEEAIEIIEFEGLFPAGHYQIRNHARTIKHANGGISMFLNELIDASQPVASLRGGHRSPWNCCGGRRGGVRPCRFFWWTGLRSKALLLASDLAKREGVVPEEGLGPEAWLASLQGFATRARRRRSIRRKSNPYIALIESGAGGRGVLQVGLSNRPFDPAHRAWVSLPRGSGDPETNRSPHLQAHEWANRLSHFLWSSVPDAVLLDVAQSGMDDALSVEAQVQRMFEDSKIDRFLESFPSQWLQLHVWACLNPIQSSIPVTGRGWKRA